MKTSESQDQLYFALQTFTEVNRIITSSHNSDETLARTAKMIAAGSDHTCILLDNHQVTCFGLGGYGQLGLGDNENRNAPGEFINLGNNPAGRPYSVFSH